MSASVKPMALRPLGTPVFCIRLMIAPASKLACILVVRVGNVHTHQPRRIQVLRRIRRTCETKDCRRVEDNRHSVRNDRVIGRVPWRYVTAYHPADRVAHAVRQMYAGVAKTDPGVGRGQKHGAAGLVVLRVLDRAYKIRRNHLDRLGRPDVADRVGALVGRAHPWRLRRVAAVVRQSGQGLQCMAQHVQPRTGGSHLGQSSGVMRIENANLRPQSPVRDSGLYMHLRQIADGDARGLTACAGGGGHGNMWPQRAGYGDAFADRRVDVVQKFGGVGGIEIGRFGRVDRGSSSYRKVIRRSCPSRAKSMA